MSARSRCGLSVIRRIASRTFKGQDYDLELVRRLKQAGACANGDCLILRGEVVAVHDGCFPYFVGDSGFEDVLADVRAGRDPRAWARPK